MTLPIDELRTAFERLRPEQPVVVTAPTGSGKSTQIPRWCAEEGRVLIVEPRRVACRSLALRLSELEGCQLGERVGYHVRDDRRAKASSQILFVTTGIALQMMAKGVLHEFDTLIVDELHERSLDVDLILALFRRHYPDRIVAMSATLDAQRVGRYLDAEHLEGQGRLHPVEIHHLPGETLLPDVRGIEERLIAAMDAAGGISGDMLVFLPGKAEISAAAQALRGRTKLEVIELHGGLSLREQARVFETGRQRRVILSTNVAETSVTLPNIGVVIDSGLVRQTRYHGGRGFLTLVPVAMDSAQQRAGRAGRLGPGVCYRLWSESARLDARTAPEIHRESLVPLVLAAAACGESLAELPFLDPPKEHAVEAAREELQALGAIDEGDRISERGAQLFGLPLEPHQGRLLVEAELTGCLDDAIDLVAVLAVGRRLFNGRSLEDQELQQRIFRTGCDATSLIRAIRCSDRSRPALTTYTLQEALRVRKRLRSAWALPSEGPSSWQIDTQRLAITALAADPRCAHVKRQHGKRAGWSNGGTEVELAKESALQQNEKIATIAVLETRAIGIGRRDTRVIATCAMPLKPEWMVSAGLGRDRLAQVAVKRGKVQTRIERVYARRVLETREEVPTGLLAREAIRDLILRASLFPEQLPVLKERLEAWALLERLPGKGFDTARSSLEKQRSGPPSSLAPEDWLLARLDELGVQHGDDIALLSGEDILPEDIPAEQRRRFDKEYPRSLSVGDASYQLHYDLGRRVITLDKIQGQRKALPPLSFLPSFPGFKILVKDGNAVRVLRP